MTRVFKTMMLFAVGYALTGCGGEPEVRKTPKVERPFVCPPAGQHIDPASLEPTMMPQIWRVLNDDNQRTCWRAAVMAMGYVGSDDAFIRLNTFIESRAGQLALAEDLNLLQQAFLSMGALAQGSGGGKSADLALDYLILGTDPANWEKRAADWRVDAVMQRELIRTLTLSAVQALGQLNSEKAHQHLLQMALDSADRRSLRFKYQESGTAADVVVYLINMHVIPPGRVAFATTEVQQSIKTMDEPDLRKLVDRVHRDAEETFKLERAWLAARQGEELFLRALRKADAVADARLSGLHGQLESLQHLLDRPEDQEAIERVQKVVFPEGPLALINAEVPDQVRRALAALAVLDERFHDDLVRLRLLDHVRTTREAHEELDRAQKMGTSGKGYEAVIAKRSELQTSLRVLVASVVAHFPGWRPGDRERQHAVLAPILEQDDQVGSYLRRLVPVRDIDPVTGSELAPLVDEGGLSGATNRSRGPRPPDPKDPPRGDDRFDDERRPADDGEGERAPDEQRSPDEDQPADENSY